MKKILGLLILVLSSLNLEAQTNSIWFNILGNEWSGINSTVPVTWRYGCAGTDVSTWKTNIGISPSVPVPSVGCNHYEIDVLQTTSTITASYVYTSTPSGGCEATYTVVILATGNPAITAVCPDGTNPLSVTPPVTTPPSTTPPVTTPPTTTTPTSPVVTTVGPFNLVLPANINLIMNCATGLTTDTVTGQNLFYIVCPSPALIPTTSPTN